MGLSSHHTTQEENMFCVPEMSMFWWEMCLTTTKQNKKKHKCHYPQWNGPYLDIGRKSTQRKAGHYSKSYLQSQIRILKMHARTNTFIVVTYML